MCLLMVRLGVSLLERFVGSGIAPIHLLNEQRRMHPSIAHFPNMQFYQGKIFSRGGFPSLGWVYRHAFEREISCSRMNKPILNLKFAFPVWGGWECLAES